MSTNHSILVLVHPGSACGSADFNLDIEAGPRREALAAEINAWPHDMLIVDGELSDELEHYAILGLMIDNAFDRPGRRIVRQQACDFTAEDWPAIVSGRFEREWPEGPHQVVVTGAWYGEGSDGCVNAVAEALSSHSVNVSANALRL